MKKIEIIFLFLILILGIGLRSVEVLNKNFLFGFDHGRDYLAVRQIVLDKKLTLIGPEVGAGFAGLSGIFHGPYYYYSLAAPFLLLRGDPYGGLLLMFVFSALSIFLIFLLVKEIFGSKAALVATLLVAVCPALSSQARFIWNSHPSTFFILLAFWATARIMRNPKLYFFLATFLAGVIYGFELAISVPLIISQFIYAFFVLKIRSFKFLLAGLLGVIFSHLPFFLFEVRHGFMALKSIFKVFALQVSPGRSFNYARVITNHLFDFWHNFRGTFLVDSKLSFLLLIYFLIITHQILASRKIRVNNSFFKFLIILPLVSFLTFLLLDNSVWDYYLIHLHLAYILIFVFYLTKIKAYSAGVILSLFLILMVPGMFREIKRAKNDYYDYGGTAKIKGKIAAVDYLYQDAQGEKFNLLVFTPPVYDYPYQYLLQWYGQRKYGYLPGAKKEGLLYLLIEPEPSLTWHKGWLETVIGPVGEVVKEETLPSGFIVQVRNVEK